MDFTIAALKRMIFRYFLIVILFSASFASFCENHIISLTISEINQSINISPHLYFKTSKEIKEAIDKGIRIQLIAKAQLYEPVSWWFDKIIDNKKINLEVSYFILGKHYVVKNKDTGEQLGFNDYEKLWSEFEQLITLKLNNQFVNNPWIKFRIMLDKGALPTAMQLPVLFDSNWVINTDWHYQQVRENE